MADDASQRRPEAHIAPIGFLRAIGSATLHRNQHQRERQAYRLAVAVRIGSATTGVGAGSAVAVTGGLGIRCTHCNTELERGQFRCHNCGNAAPRVASKPRSATPASATSSGDGGGKLAERRAAKQASRSAQLGSAAESAGGDGPGTTGLSDAQFAGLFGKELSTRQGGGECA